MTSVCITARGCAGPTRPTLMYPDYTPPLAGQKSENPDIRQGCLRPETLYELGMLTKYTDTVLTSCGVILP